MNVLQWMPRFTVLVALSVTSVYIASAQGPNGRGTEEKPEIKVAKVFININGNPKLAHRLWTFIDLEMEDSGILVTNTEADADTIINGTISTKTEPLDLAIGVIKIQLTAHEKVERIDSCASLSTQKNGELFDITHNDVADKLRQKYPEAKTIMIDPASDMTASALFSKKLPAQLKASGFSIVNAKPADLFLRVELVREKVTIEEDQEIHEISVASRDRQMELRASGGGVLSARLKGHAPEACPDRVESLEWLTMRDGLFETSRDIAKRFRKQNTKVSPSPSGMNTN